MGNRGFVKRMVRCAALTTALLGLQVPAASASVDTIPRAAGQPDGRVAAIVIDPVAHVVYLGGSFTHVRDVDGRIVARNHLAALDATSGVVLNWSTGTDGEVRALALAGGTLYVGGKFAHVTDASGTGARKNLAELNAVTGALLPWDPGPGGAVDALSSSPSRLYVGGEFASVAGSSRSRLAAFSLAGQLDTGWTPSASGAVLGITYSPELGRVYVGGGFKELDGKSARGYAGSIEPVTGAVDQNFVSPGFKIYGFAADANGVYGGGGGSGGHLVFWNPDGSLRHVYQLDGGVESVAVAGGEVYAGGHFTNWCVGDIGSGHPFICTKPLLRRKLLSVRQSDGTITAWAPKADSPLGAWSMAVNPADGTLHIGGDFTTINDHPRAHYAAFTET
jgi:hypothetical protein